MLLFAFAFAGIGYIVPEIYYKYFDNTQYYTITNPVTVEGALFKPCDKVTVEIHRKALIATTAISVRELVLVKDNIEVARFRSDISINLNEEIVHTQWQLPCDLDPGIYMFRGIVNYQYRGVEKYTEFRSTEFEVIVPLTTTN
jgi:hypothetical protein